MFTEDQLRQATDNNSIVEIAGHRYELRITGEAEVIPGPNRAANLAAAGLPPDPEE